MAEHLPGEESLFLEALQRSSPEARAAYVDGACAGTPELHQRVLELLRSHEESQGPFDFPAAVDTQTIISAAVSNAVGAKIGPYKLLQQIGEGGMGTVFMAEQTHPVQRKVALKVIKPGMDSRQIIARFEAERQALALMDHVNIARVLDAGATDAGRPYFVMELVHGVPITKYCDEHQLTPRQRLELFVPVCQAIQHAHQKGIIHRDIKPSNVLVTLYDGRPVPKVIDFGVAKAIEQKLTERTLFTQFGTMVGTLEYMSPEQAEMSALGVDTRSDIYSLGVLLYELLTGSTPLSRQRLKEVAFAEILRLIKEEEPPRPSTRLSESGESLASISSLRHTEPARLTKLMRGELDWIVMKPLEKDRSRRYETANAFAADVQRYLDDEPVQACPPSTWYSLRKFARRNRMPLAVGAVLAVSLLVAAGGVGWALQDRAAHQRQLAQDREVKQAKVSGQLELILEEVTRLAEAEKWSEALRSAFRAEPLIALGEAPPEIQDRVQQALDALKLVQQLDDIRAHSGTIWGSGQSVLQKTDLKYAETFRQAGLDMDALPLDEVVRRIASRRMIAGALLPVLDDWIAVRSADADEASTRRLRDVLQSADPDLWRRKVREALTRQDWPALDKLATSADMDRQPAATVSLLYAAFHAQGRFQAGESVLHRAQRRFPADFWINHTLGVKLIYNHTPSVKPIFNSRSEQVLEGMGYMRAAVAIRPESSHAMMNLGNGYAAMGLHDEAIAHFRKALEINPRYAGCYGNIGIAHARLGRYDEAILAFDEAIRLQPATDPMAHREFVGRYAELSMIHSSRSDEQRRNVPRAVELAEKAVEFDPQVSYHWTALGVARYRSGQWLAARIALEKSLELGTFSRYSDTNADEAIDWFALAICQRRLEREAESRQCYEKGLVWMKQHSWRSESLLRFHDEAAQLLGMQDSGQRDQQAIGFDQRGQALEKQGQNDQAQSAYSQAIEHYELLSIAFPVVPGYANKLVELLPKTGRKHEIEYVYRRAINGFAVLRDPQPEQRLTQANYCNDLARDLLAGNWRSEAEQFVRQALQLKLALTTEFPDKPEYRFHLAHSYLGLAHIVAEPGRESEVVQANTEAGRIFRQLAADGSGTADFRQWNAHALWQLGDAWLKLNRLDEGQQAYQQSLVTFQELATANPANHFYRQEQGFSLRLLAKVAEQAGRKEEAVRRQREAIVYYEGLVGEVPDSAFYLSELALVDLRLTGILARDAQFAVSEQAYRQAIATLDAQLAKFPSNTGAKPNFADESNQIAWPLMMESDAPKPAVQLAILLAQRATELHPSAGHIWSTLAMVRYRAGDWQEALVAHDRASELGYHSGTSRLFSAMIHWRLGHHEQAGEHYDDACRWIDRHEMGRDEQKSRLRREAHDLIQREPGVGNQASANAGKPK